MRFTGRRVSNSGDVDSSFRPLPSLVSWLERFSGQTCALGASVCAVRHVRQGGSDAGRRWCRLASWDDRRRLRWIDTLIKRSTCSAGYSFVVFM